MACDHKITLGQMRAVGVRSLLIYCRDHHCSHSTRISGDAWGDAMRLSELEPLFTCTVFAASMAARYGPITASSRVDQASGVIPEKAGDHRAGT